MKLKHTKLAFFCILLLLGCEKRPDLLPYVPVNLTINLNYPQFSSLTYINGTPVIFENEGVNGIILFRAAEDKLIACDLTCTHHPDDNIAVEIDKDWSHLLNCPECGSQYNLLLYGSPDVGPAKYSLEMYKVSLSGSILRVTN